MACLFSFWSGAVFSQDFVFDKNTADAYQRVLDLRFEEGKSLLPDPRTPQELYVVSFAEALELIISEDPRLFSVYESAFEQRLSKKRRKQNADEMLLQAELHFQWAFIYLKFGKELDAAFRLRQAYLLTKDIREKYPGYRAIQKTSGLLNVMVGSVPEKYHWILNILHMSGSVTNGLSQLKRLSAHNHTFSFEATLWHAFTLGFMLQQPEKAIIAMNDLLTVYPHNPLAEFMIANFYLKNGSSEDALAFLSGPDNRIPYTHYLRGEIFLHKGAYAEAIGAYTRFLDQYAGQNYLKDAHYKIGLSYWLDGNRDRAITAFRTAQSMGKESTEADKHAARNLASGELPPVELTKARFYTDGGYYREAEELLARIDPARLITKKEQVEYHYRKARLFHKLARLDDAKAAYEQTIAQAGDHDWYFAPNACLQLGYIAVSRQELKDARYYFEKALSYKRHEYKNSIDSKARSALAQLNDSR